MLHVLSDAKYGLWYGVGVRILNLDYGQPQNMVWGGRADLAIPGTG